MRRIQVLLVASWAILLAAALLVAPVFSADPGKGLTRNTVRVALLFYGLAVVLVLRRAPEVLARLCWTLAWAAFVVHVGMAFHHQLDWSHARALEHTRQVSGVGAGLYVSYLFTLLWTADVLWWWRAPAGRAARPPWVDAGLHGFMLFMVFNATVVFESGLIRWAGVALVEVLGRLWLYRRPCPDASGGRTTEKTPGGGDRAGEGGLVS